MKLVIYPSVPPSFSPKFLRLKSTFAISATRKSWGLPLRGSFSVFMHLMIPPICCLRKLHSHAVLSLSLSFTELFQQARSSTCMHTPHPQHYHHSHHAQHDGCGRYSCSLHSFCVDCCDCCVCVHEHAVAAVAVVIAANSTYSSLSIHLYTPPAAA